MSDHEHSHDHDHSHGGDVAGSPETHRQPLEPGAGIGKVVFFDAASGTAGDMTIAALVDLGVPFEVVRKAVAALSLRGVRVSVSKAFAGSIGATKFEVSITGEQHERSYSQIRRLIDSSGLSDSVKRLAQRIFLRLAESESRVHRIPLDDVHFHEVGAVDAICDIVGTSACIDYLGASVVCSPLPLGRGFVECRHGTIPLPAPATVNCLQGIETYDAGLEVELVTPTGAAIVGALATGCERWPAGSPIRVGWGRGMRDLPDRPNALRVVLIEPAAARSKTHGDATHELLECNIDDMTGEQASHAIAQLLDAGAVDAWATPVTMKKGRPAWVLSALAPRGMAGRVTHTLLCETTSIGVRHTPVSRTALPRRMLEVSTDYGVVPVKLSGQADTFEFHVKPEFETCQRLAAQHGVPVRFVLEAAVRAATPGLSARVTT